MDQKLQELLANINFPDDLYVDLNNCSLSKVKISEKNKLIKIILNSEQAIPVNTYIKLVQYLNDFFGINCYLEIKTKKNGFNRIQEYFNYFTEDEKYKFIRSKLKCNFNNYYIEVNNESEQREISDLLKEINEKLDNVGITNLEIIINEFNRTKVNDAINDFINEKSFDEIMNKYN